MLTVDFDRINVQFGDVILDAGCGAGRHSFECIARGANVFSMDLDLESLRKARYVLEGMKMYGDAPNESRYQVHIGDALNLPFRDETFDKIICSEVMEHVDDDEMACRELVRTVKSGGIVVVTVPTYFSEIAYDLLTEEYFISPGGHVRKYLPNRIVEIMRGHQLEIYDVKFKHSFHVVYWLIRCVVGLHLDDHPLTKGYHKFLTMVLKSNMMRKVETFFDNFFPKSMVIYSVKN